MKTIAAIFAIIAAAAILLSCAYLLIMSSEADTALYSAMTADALRYPELVRPVLRERLQKGYLSNRDYNDIKQLIDAAHPPMTDERWQQYNRDILKHAADEPTVEEQFKRKIDAIGLPPAESKKMLEDALRLHKERESK